jgi:hypothetical protein
MCALNSIESVCSDLDFLCDPAVEESMVCDFGCCILHCRNRDIFNNPPAELRDLLGDEGLQLTHQLDEVVRQGIEAVDYGEKKGFSKTKEWLDFVDRISKINIFLKDILRKNGRAIE